MSYIGNDLATDQVFLPDGVGAVSRTIPSKLKDTVSARDFGAVGDGVTDDTAAIQAAVDAAPIGTTIDGGGLLYLVTSINLKSNINLTNFRLKTKGGSVDFVSPITIGSWYNTNTVSNIILKNINVDGNRINQTNIGGAEDGGRHGFRLLGNCSNIAIYDCSATYCASDGIELYSGIGTGTNPKKFNNILISNCQFTWNRRHGMSLDSADGVTFEKCIFSNNGQDLNSVDPLSSGGRGARSGGNLYGNGCDIEGYGVGSQITRIKFNSCTALQNVRAGITFYDVTSPLTAGFTISDNILVSGCTLDKGNGTGGAADIFCLQFTGSIANRTLGPIYSNVVVRDCLLNDAVLLRTVNKATVEGGLIGNSGGYLGTLDYATNVVVGEIQRAGFQFYTDSSTVTYPFTAPTGAILTSTRTTIANGATLDLGVVRTTTLGILRIVSKGTLISGGQFAVDVVLLGGGGIVVSSLYNGGQVGASGANQLQVITTGTNWALKNNETLGNAMDISYCLMS